MPTEHQRLRAIWDQQEEIANDFVRRAKELQDRLPDLLAKQLGIGANKVKFLECAAESGDERLVGPFTLLTSKGLSFSIQVDFGPDMVNVPVEIHPSTSGLVVETSERNFDLTHPEALAKWANFAVSVIENYIRSDGIEAAIAAAVQGRTVPSRRR